MMRYQKEKKLSESSLCHWWGGSGECVRVFVCVSVCLLLRIAMRFFWKRKELFIKSHFYALYAFY